jgi:chromosome segregation ATPase
MTDIDKLREEYEQAERDAQAIMAEKDELRDRLRKATDAAAAKQKEWMDAEATAALIERYPDPDERRAVMTARGLDLPGALE